MAGMVGITPGSGFVSPIYSIVIGIISKLQAIDFLQVLFNDLLTFKASVLSRLAYKIKKWIKFDDTCNVFAG